MALQRQLCKYSSKQEKLTIVVHIVSNEARGFCVAAKDDPNTDRLRAYHDVS